MRWLDEAVDDLRDIGRYLAEQSSVERGERISNEIADTTFILPDHPFAGPVINEDVLGRHRHLICYSYRIIYRVEDEVVIIAVIHGARLLQPAILRRK